MARNSLRVNWLKRNWFALFIAADKQLKKPSLIKQPGFFFLAEIPFWLPSYRRPPAGVTVLSKQIRQNGEFRSPLQV